MDLREINSTKEPTGDDQLNAVAARIRPLPASVVPSHKFMEQMRLHLLGLDAQRAPRAA